VSLPPLVTPLLMRSVAACLVRVKNCSSMVSEIFTGRRVMSAAAATSASSLM
jgi:hypothetical protein